MIIFSLVVFFNVTVSLFFRFLDHFMFFFRFLVVDLLFVFFVFFNVFFFPLYFLLE
jgi:hypothetical protein